MKARPIGKHLLIHDVTLTNWGEDTGRGATSTITEVKNVRIQPRITRVYNATTGIAVLGSMLMFWDTKNSGDANFFIGDTITFEGTDYDVIDINPIPDGVGIHHKEVVLK
jgi:hypothetical protein